MSAVYIISHRERRWHLHAWVAGLSNAYHSHEVDIPSVFDSEVEALDAALHHADAIDVPPPLEVFSMNEAGKTKLLYRSDS